MSRKRIAPRLLALATVLATMAVQAAPSISIGTMFDYLAPGKSTLLKQVRNSGDTTAFVRVTVSEIEYREGQEPVEHPLDTKALFAGTGTGLIASPSRLIVPANGLQSTRLLFKGSRDKEHHYRVRFLPVLPEAGDDFALDDAEREQYKSHLVAGVNILTGYGGIVIVRPRKAHFDTQIEHQEKTVIVHNKGNSTVVLDALTECDEKRENCTAPSVRHVRPHGQIAFERKAGHSVLFNLLEGDEKREMNIR